MSEIVRTDGVEDGSTEITVRLDMADLLKADRTSIDQLEISMRKALEVITGAPDPAIAEKERAARRRALGRNLFAFVKAVLVFFAVLATIALIARGALWVAVEAWGLIP
jgi:hypothetical protein